MSDPVVVKVNAESPDPTLVERAIAVLTSGGLVVAPSETQYGLLARADQDAALERAVGAKQRGAEKPMAVFAASVELIMHYASLNPPAQRLARLFLPGPLTLVLPVLGSWHTAIVPEGKIGIRVSSCPFIQATMERVDFPVTATSANIAGDQESSDVVPIARLLGDQVDLFLDGGPLPGPPSTVVDCCESEVKILREGAIDSEAIKAALAKVM